MSKLKKYKFSDLYDFSSGISSKPEQAGHGFPFLSFSTVFNNYFIPECLPDLMDTSVEEQQKYSILEGDIFLTRTSETINELGMSCVAIKNYPNATYSGFLKRLRPLQQNVTYSKYIAFYLRSNYFRKTMTNNAVLTLRASLNEQIFSYLNLLLPEYEEQVKIGDFLFSINKKIELNNKINAELESMAKTLYDYWFVQFDFPDKNDKPYKSSGREMVRSDELKKEIPKGREAKKVGDLVEVKRGKNITRKTVIEGNVPVIAAGLEPSCYHNISNTSSPVITISGSGANAGYVQLHSQEVWASDCSYIDNTMLSQIHFMYLFLSRKQNEIYDMQKGSAQPHVYPQDIMNIKILLDEGQEILTEFENILIPIYEKIGKNKQENQTLSSLRDWLLPMLMNRQVAV